MSNSLHAVETRWGEQTTASGEINIVVHRRAEDDNIGILGFSVTDNGIGLTAENWTSFLTSDSPLKSSKGGKGVGRLGWLKAFSDCQIISRFEDADGIMLRQFSFALRKGKNPIHGYKLTKEAGPGAIGTEVRLVPYQTQFEAYCPKKATTIAAKLVGHFLNYFVVGKLPRMTLTDSWG